MEPFDHTKIQVSPEDVSKLYIAHKAYVNKVAPVTKEAVKVNARLHMMYVKICHELADKYGYDAAKYLVTLQGTLVEVKVVYK